MSIGETVEPKNNKIEVLWTYGRGDKWMGEAIKESSLDIWFSMLNMQFLWMLYEFRYNKWRL